MSKDLVPASRAMALQTFLHTNSEVIADAALGIPSDPKERDKYVRRVIRIVSGAVQRNPRLAQSTEISTLQSIREAVNLGFEPGDAMGCAYLVPYREKGTMQTHLIVGYQGLVELAYRHPSVLCIQSGVVCEGDEFDFVLGARSYIKHRISPEHLPVATIGSNGELIETNVQYAWATIETRGGGTINGVLSLAEIESHRKRSRATSGPWYTDYGPMCRKTALRVTLKTVPKMKELQQAIALENAAEAGHSTDGIIDLPPLEIIAEEGGTNPPEEEHNGEQDTHESSPPSPANPSEISDAEYEAAMNDARKEGEA